MEVHSFDFGEGTLSGNYESEIYVDPENSQCVYFRLSTTSNTTASFDGADFMILPAGASTGWCHYTGGTVDCPFDDTTGFSVSESYDGIGFDLSTSIGMTGQFTASSSSITVPLNFSWNMSTNIECVGNLSYTINFPSADFINIAPPGTGTSANSSASCTAPPASIGTGTVYATNQSYKYEGSDPTVESS